MLVNHNNGQASCDVSVLPVDRIWRRDFPRLGKIESKHNQASELSCNGIQISVYLSLVSGGNHIVWGWVYPLIV